MRGRAVEACFTARLAVSMMDVDGARVRTSIPMPVGPEAPVTQTTLPFRLKSSRRDSAFGTPIGMIEVDKRQRGVEWDELIVKGITELLC